MQLFICLDGELMYKRARAQATLLLSQLKSYNLAHTGGEGTVADDNRMHKFQPVRALATEQLLCCLQ